MEIATIFIAYCLIFRHMNEMFNHCVQTKKFQFLQDEKWTHKSFQHNKINNI